MYKLEELIECLRTYRDDWTDEIPSEMVSASRAPKDGSKYKIWSAWFLKARLYLSLAHKQGYLDQEFDDEVKEFMQKLRQDRREHLCPETGISFTKKEHINNMDNYLTKAICLLEKQL